MPVTGNKNRIFLRRVQPGTLLNPGRKVLSDLEGLAGLDEPISDLSLKLFSRLRKMLGSPELNANLLGIQYLAYLGGKSGARLLAAYLDVTTAGARLIPRVNKFSSTARQSKLFSQEGKSFDESGKEWQARCRNLQGKCKGLVTQESGQKEPLVNMRLVLEKLLTDVVTGEGLNSTHRVLLTELLRLETDAWQERISRLAGSVNPYRVAAVQRILPLLNRADSDIRDLRQLISWVQEGQDQKAFTQQGFRALEVLESQEFDAIYAALKKESNLHVLAGLHRGARDNPLTLDVLGTAVARMLALDHKLVRSGSKEEELDLLSAVSTVHQFARGREVVLPLDQDQELALSEALADLSPEDAKAVGKAGWSISGFSVIQGQLILDLGSAGETLIPWPQGLPANEDKDPTVLPETPEDVSSTEELSPAEENQKKELDNSAIKNLVMSNITSVSILLGFLRNPKVVSIPGLVAAIAARTRNPQIIETIATDRTLYSGFANRDVPLICLQSPCNVSPKVLRRFIHVKYVSKVDLRRMAGDRSGIRKEVAREIVKYLDALS